MEETSRIARSKVRRVHALAAPIGLALVLVLGGCGDGSLSDGLIPTITTQGGDDGASAPEETAPPETAPPDTAPPETAPPETAPPETAPPETAPQPEGEEDSGLNGRNLLLLALLVAGVLAILAVVRGMSSSRKPASGPDPQSSRMADLLSGCRWVHDQGSMEILRTSDPAQLGRAWQVTGARIVELEGWAGSLAIESTEPARATALQDLGRAASGLRSALESDVSLRADPGMVDRDDLVRASAQTVQQRRMDLDVALANPALGAR